MATKFHVQTIIDESGCKRLLDIFHRLPQNLAHQDYNLFDVDKRGIPFAQWNEDITKINHYASDLEPQAHYFVKYEKDSFTRLHTDNDKVVKLTIVTLIDTENLIGGETLVFDKYTKDKRPANRYAKRVGNGKAPVGRDIIPVVVDIKNGESVIYDAATHHAVTQVKQGHRIVLVSWFK